MLHENHEIQKKKGRICQWSRRRNSDYRDSHRDGTYTGSKSRLQILRTERTERWRTSRSMEPSKSIRDMPTQDIIQYFWQYLPVGSLQFRIILPKTL